MTEKKKSRRRGRPTSYKPEFSAIAKKMCELGATDDDLAEAFGVTEKTINNWKKDHPDFLQSLKAKGCADDLVEAALFKRATGAVVKDDKVFNNNGTPLVVPGKKEYPPDTAACFIWLQNRRPAQWKRNPEGGGDTLDKLAEILSEFAKNQLPD